MLSKSFARRSKRPYSTNMKTSSSTDMKTSSSTDMKTSSSTDMKTSSSTDMKTSSSTFATSTTPMRHEKRMDFTSERSHSLRKTVHSAKSTKLQKWHQRLQGSRFRYLNEWLYVNSGDKAFSAFQNSPELFFTYHQGYQGQVRQWPVNPLDFIIKWLETCPANLKIGDFGCGEARIATTFPERTILSFDLVASNPLVTACNIAKVPLQDATLDIAILCLSLMGNDWPKYILEAFRCLKTGGVLAIAEVSSRIADVNTFLVAIETVGFKIKEKKDINSFFLLVILEKKEINKYGYKDSVDTKKPKKRQAHASACSSTALLQSSLLKPCLYKKR